MKAYLYDFDKTICPGDSGSEFWFFCLVRKPWLAVFLPVQAIGGLCYLCGILPKVQRACSIHSFVRAIDTDKMAAKFRDKKLRRVYPFFRERKRDLPTVVCSASPDFLIRPICDSLGVEVLIATSVSAETGRIYSDVCKKHRKLVRLEKELPGWNFEEVYSDSLKNDVHILRLGKRAFHTVKGKVTEIDLSNLK